MITLDVRIEPAEPILFGDNRSARAGEGHAVADQDPSPATIHGAIGGRIAHRLGARGERHWAPAAGILGPFCRELDQPAAQGSRAELPRLRAVRRRGRSLVPEAAPSAD